MKKKCFILLVTLCSLTAVYGDDSKATFINSSKNQAIVMLDDGQKVYYNTESLSDGITINGNVVNIGGDTYDEKVTNISFAKSIKQNLGKYTNENGRVIIEDARGWYESAFVKFNYYDTDSFVCYVKGGIYDDYTRIDAQLLRRYPNYYRVDALGLRAEGDYSIKVVPVIDSLEKEEYSNEATMIRTSVYPREGFAHYNRTIGIGGYNNDGTPKTKAKILYVSAANAKSVSTYVMTNNNGDVQSVAYTGLQAILTAYSKGVDLRPLIIRVIGKVTAEDTDCGESGILKIECPVAYTTLDITIEGVGDDASLCGIGLYVSNGKSIEIRNMASMLYPSYSVYTELNCSNLWIHNMDFFYGKSSSRREHVIEMRGVENVTVNHNHFYDAGSSFWGDGVDDDRITFHHNWFDHSDTDNPHICVSKAHVFNNYYDGNSKYGICSGSNSTGIFAESNYFRNSMYPMLTFRHGTDATARVVHSSKIGNGGIIKSYNNIMSGQERCEPWSTSAGDDWDIYEASSYYEQIPSSVKIDDIKYSNFDTGDDMYTYSADKTQNIPSIITGWLGAGRMAHGDIQWDFYNDKEDRNSMVVMDLKDAITSYSDDVVKIYGNIDTGNNSYEEEKTDVKETPEGPAAVSWYASKSGRLLSTDQRFYADSIVHYDEPQVYEGKSYEYGAFLGKKGSININLDQEYEVTFVCDTTYYFGYINGLSIAENGGNLIDVKRKDNIMTANMPAGTYYVTYRNPAATRDENGEGRPVSIYLIILNQ